MLIKRLQKLKNSNISPNYLAFSFKKNVSEWKKQQEIKKKIIDMNEADSLRTQINQRTFGFSLFSGIFLIFIIFFLCKITFFRFF